MDISLGACLVIAALTLAACTLPASLAHGEPRDYAFDGSITRPVLENYLARSITMMDLLSGRGNPDDNIRMLKDTGAKFAGRALYRWGGEHALPDMLARARTIVPKVHAADPELILQAGIYEIVSHNVSKIPVPAWVFEEFDLSFEERTFNYEAMRFPEGHHHNHWYKGASVPDITQRETRMWFFYLAAEYVQVGCEAIHFGQVALIGKSDKDHAHWWDVLSRVRRYAKQHARRRMVICDAHTPHGGPRYDSDKLLFDFHSFPLRIDEVPDRPQEGVLKMGYLDSLFGRSNGGLTPSGWRCEHLPFLVELDNFETTGKEGQNIGGHWIWGQDEIVWFAHQPEAYRNQWLRYAWKWVREHDANGFLEMPGSRGLAYPVEGENGRRIGWYFANRPSAATPTGFNQEDTIKAIWATD